MAESTSLAESAPVSGDDLRRAEEFAREPFVLEGEDAATALATGTARRRALDAALDELAAGREDPSVDWRREYSLMLGLERLLSDEEPKLADGTALSAHQVDALSGTLIALTAEVQAAAERNGNGRNGQVEELPSGEVEIEGDDELSDDEEPLDWDAAEEAEEEAAADAVAGGPQRHPPLLVRARHRRRQDRGRAGIRRGVAHRRGADPHPPPQPRGPVQRRAGRPRLQEARAGPAAARKATRTPTRRARSPSRPTSGSCATPARSPTRTRSSSATRPTRRWARRPRRRSASGRARSSSA